MHLFYTPDLNAKHHTYLLSEEESKHCIKVLRLSIEDEVILIDGRGGWFTGKIIDSHPKRTIISITSSIFNFQKRNHYLHIAIAPTKNIDRFEWFLEKSTEMGIDEITPIICAHSERREVKIERLGKRITAAVKQSLKAYHPILNEPILFADFVSENKDCQKFIAHCFEDEKSYLSNLIEKHGRYTILIGPEGDFSPNEIEIALLSEYMPISLGEARLRTETAALASCFEVNYLNR